MDFKLIGRRIQEKRKEKNLKQRELAEILGFSDSYISQIERGVYHVNLDVLSQICDVLECDVAEILSSTNEPSPSYLIPEIHDLVMKLDENEKHFLYDALQLYILNIKGKIFP